MSGRSLFMGLWALIILGGLGTAGWFLLGPGGGSGGPHAASANTAFHPASVTSPVPQDAATVASITQTWQRLFDPATPLATRERLLQGGRRFAPALAAYSRSGEGAATVVSVDSVTVRGGSADVVYTVYVHKVDELNRVRGSAVRDSGRWQVSAASFCRVLAYENLPAAACPAGG